MKQRKSTFFILFILIPFVSFCKHEGATSGDSTSKILHPPGQEVSVSNPEGNLLQPGNLYTGDWLKSQWYTFKFALKSMTSLKLLATNANPAGGKVDLKVSQMGNEFYTSMTSSNPSGPHSMRLPAGEYKVTIVLSVDGDPAKAGKWTLSVSPLKGKEASSCQVPPDLLRQIQSAFPGGVHRISFPPSQRPEFDFIMEAWLWKGTKDRVVYAKQATPIYPFDTQPWDIVEGKGGVLQIQPGEPLIVYDLIDIYAARVYTADGLDGIVSAEALQKDPPVAVNLPTTIRLAPPNLRKVAPLESEIQANGGILALLYHPSYQKYIAKGKVQKCLSQIEKQSFVEFEKKFNEYSTLPPWQEGLEKKGSEVEEAWKKVVADRDSCLAPVWEKVASSVDAKIKTEGLFVVLNKIRRIWELEEVPIPAELPAILPVPPPPPPPPPPPAQQPQQPPSQFQPSVPTSPAQPQIPPQTAIPPAENQPEVIGPSGPGTFEPEQQAPKKGKQKKTHQPQQEEVIGPSG